MFEQATLTNGPAGKRAWTTLLGMTSQLALVSVAVLAPMVWPQVLPLAKFETLLAPPLPPPGPQPLDNRPHKAAGHPRVIRDFQPQAMVEPAKVPEKTTILDEVAPDTPYISDARAAVPGGGSGSNVGITGGILRDLLSNERVPEPPKIEPARPVPAAAAAVVPPLRYKPGGLVQLGKVLHKGEPDYPNFAKTARIQGNVELECVVGVDGHIIEVQVKSGNPLLVKAAVEAAWKWVYEPTKLNHLPIELVTIMTFTFRLN